MSVAVSIHVFVKISQGVPVIRKASFVLTACAVSLMAAATVRADDAADAKAVVEKAIKAMGGAEKLDQTKAFTSKMKGKVFVMGWKSNSKRRRRSRSRTALASSQTLR